MSVSYSKTVEDPIDREEIAGIVAASRREVREDYVGILSKVLAVGDHLSLSHPSLAVGYLLGLLLMILDPLNEE